MLDLSDRMFAWWHRVRDGTLNRSSFQVYISGLRAEVREALLQGAACGCPKTAATCRNLLAQEAKLWTFVWGEGVEPTNNAVERARAQYGTPPPSPWDVFRPVVHANEAADRVITPIWEAAFSHIWDAVRGTGTRP